MKKLKVTMAAFLVVPCVLMLAACGGKDKDKDNKDIPITKAALVGTWNLMYLNLAGVMGDAAATGVLVLNEDNSAIYQMQIISSLSETAAWELTSQGYLKLHNGGTGMYEGTQTFTMELSDNSKKLVITEINNGHIFTLTKAS